MTQLVPWGHILLLALWALRKGVCTQPKSRGFFPWSFPYVNYGKVQPLLCPLGCSKTQVTFNWWDTQEGVLGLGAEVVSHSLNRNFWAARMGAEDFHPLYVWQQLQFFFQAWIFWGVWLKVCDRRRSWVSLWDFRAGVNFYWSRCCSRTKSSWGSYKPGGAWR